MGESRNTMHAMCCAIAIYSKSVTPTAEGTNLFPELGWLWRARCASECTAIHLHATPQNARFYSLSLVFLCSMHVCWSEPSTFKRMLVPFLNSAYFLPLFSRRSNPSRMLLFMLQTTSIAPHLKFLYHTDL
jgi:hypothetical protein